MPRRSTYGLHGRWPDNSSRRPHGTACKPGSILLPQTMLDLVEGYVAVKSLGLVPVKGLAQAVDVFEITGPGPARTRLQASARRGLTRFVGRDAANSNNCIAPSNSPQADTVKSWHLLARPELENRDLFTNSRNRTGWKAGCFLRARPYRTARPQATCQSLNSSSVTSKSMITTTPAQSARKSPASCLRLTSCCDRCCRCHGSFRCPDCTRGPRGACLLRGFANARSLQALRGGGAEGARSELANPRRLECRRSARPHHRRADAVLPAGRLWIRSSPNVSLAHPSTYSRCLPDNRTNSRRKDDGELVLTRLPCRSATMDGELVLADEARINFYGLRGAPRGDEVSVRWFCGGGRAGAISWFPSRMLQTRGHQRHRRKRGQEAGEVRYSRRQSRRSAASRCVAPSAGRPAVAKSHQTPGEERREEEIASGYQRLCVGKDCFKQSCAATRSAFVCIHVIAGHYAVRGKPVLCGSQPLAESPGGAVRAHPKSFRSRKNRQNGQRTRPRPETARL